MLQNLKLIHTVPRSALRPGDHIYVWRSAWAYTHHGIYVGNDSVIHFSSRWNQERHKQEQRDTNYEQGLSFQQQLYSQFALVNTPLDAFLEGIGELKRYGFFI